MKKSCWKMRGVNEIFSKREKTLLDRQSGGKRLKITKENRIFLRERKLYWKCRAGEHINLLRPKSVVPVERVKRWKALFCFPRSKRHNHVQEIFQIKDWQ